MSGVDKAAFWLSVVVATVMATLLGFRLAGTDLDWWTYTFAVVWSWMGIYFGLDHVYTMARRMKDGPR